MTKNITVVDENMNITGCTYRKRALGLVKKGRARWVSNDAIMLRTDYTESEATDMANNIYEVFDNQVSKMQEQLREQPAESTTEVRVQILKTMETMRKADYAERVLDIVSVQLDAMQDSMKNACSPENELARETTRQKMIGLMEKLLLSEVFSAAPEKAGTETVTNTTVSAAFEPNETSTEI